ncbi:MAG: SelL-related redox protein [Phycisphaerales bacterium]|nr:SelL-related redox protein [bacterium]
MSDRSTTTPNFADAIANASTQSGESLKELSERSPVLVVFLRHLGCTFCREAVADIAKQRTKIEADGTQICFVYMPQTDKAGSEKPEVAERFFSKYGVGDVHRIADPDQHLYKAFELRRGSLRELFGLKVWWRGFLATVFGLHMVGKLVGDGFQMPGVFLLKNGRIERAFRHKTAADRPDYCELASA